MAEEKLYTPDDLRQVLIERTEGMTAMEAKKATGISAAYIKHLKDGDMGFGKIFAEHLGYEQVILYRKIGG